MKRALRWAAAVGALALIHWGLGRVLAGHDPLADLIMGQPSAAPVLLMFYITRLILIIGLPTLAAWRLVFTIRGAAAPRDGRSA